jgi:hypothetical protein
MTAAPHNDTPAEPARRTPPATSYCWLCTAPNPRGSATLGGGPGGGTKIAVCAAGEGCNDGKIWHGPTARSHYPGEECESHTCETAVTGGRRTGRSTRRPRR